VAGARPIMARSRRSSGVSRPYGRYAAAGADEHAEDLLDEERTHEYQGRRRLAAEDHPAAQTDEAVGVPGEGVDAPGRSGVAGVRGRRSQATNLYFLGDVGGIADTARAALQREEAGSDYWPSALLTSFGVAEFLSGESLSAATLLDDAVAASERPHHSLALVHALGWCALVHAELGEPDRADQALAGSGARSAVTVRDGSCPTSASIRTRGPEPQPIRPKAPVR
jgi:hypothetical protein